MLIFAASKTISRKPWTLELNWNWTSKDVALYHKNSDHILDNVGWGSSYVSIVCSDFTQIIILFNLFKTSRKSKKLFRFSNGRVQVILLKGRNKKLGNKVGTFKWRVREEISGSELVQKHLNFSESHKTFSNMDWIRFY